MSDIKVGIFHKDQRYGKRLMDYLNHQKEYPMTAWYTKDLKKLKKREQEFSCLILAEEDDYGCQVPVCELVENIYQPASFLARQIYDHLHVTTRDREQMVAIFSPEGSYIGTQVALEFAKRNHLYYMGMQPFSFLETDPEPVEQLLLGIKEGTVDGEYFIRNADSFHGIMGYGQAKCSLDYRVPAPKEYERFFENLREDGVSLVVDLGVNMWPDYSFFLNFDQVYVVIGAAQEKENDYQEFLRQASRYGKVPAEKFRKVVVSHELEGREIVDLL